VSGEVIRINIHHFPYFNRHACTFTNQGSIGLINPALGNSQSLISSELIISSIVYSKQAFRNYRFQHVKVKGLIVFGKHIKHNAINLPGVRLDPTQHCVHSNLGSLFLGKSKETIEHGAKRDRFDPLGDTSIK
jgi:hypothetical protein